MILEKFQRLGRKILTFGKPMMIMVGKTNCVWCESMAPQLKEIKEEYPDTIIYYMNSDKEPMWAIKHHILELPVQIFYNSHEVRRLADIQAISIKMIYWTS